MKRTIVRSARAIMAIGIIGLGAVTAIGCGPSKPAVGAYTWTSKLASDEPVTPAVADAAARLGCEIRAQRVDGFVAQCDRVTIELVQAGNYVKRVCMGDATQERCSKTWAAVLDRVNVWVREGEPASSASTRTPEAPAL